MTFKTFRYLVCLGTLATIPAAVALAQVASPFTATTYTQYPSLTPVSAISIHFGTFGDQIYDAEKKVLADPNAHWDCANPGLYKAMATDKSKKSRPLRITAVRLMGKDPNTGSRYTTCIDPSHPAIVDLVLGSHIDSSDLIQVSIYKDTTQTEPALFTSDGKLTFSASTYPAFTATPQAAPGEALNRSEEHT